MNEHRHHMDVGIGQLIASVIIGGFAAMGFDAVGAAIGVGIVALVRSLLHAARP